MNIEMADFVDDISSLNDDLDLTSDDAPLVSQSRDAFVHDFNKYNKCESKLALNTEERCDSGINSMGISLHSFIESSLENTNYRKKPEECETISECLPEFTKLSLEDEGICSLPAFTCSRIVIDFSEQDKDGDTFVNLAIIAGYEPLACTLIDLVPNVNSLNISNSLYQGPLHLAVVTKQVKVLQRLLSKNVDLSCQDHQGNTPLHLACRTGHLSSVKAILKAVRERQALQCLEVRNSEGLTCLHVAARLADNQIDILHELIRSGANVNATEAKSGRTVLHYACERRDMELVRFLLKCTRIEIDFVSFDGKPAIYIAYWRNYQDIVKCLIRAGADFDYDVLNDVSDDSDNENV